MAKVSMPISNDFCPQTLFLYGTDGEGGPDFGLFCWFSYIWDGGLGVMACIGGEKLTKDRIRKNKVFSACLVTEKILPRADSFGNIDGNTPGKVPADLLLARGQVLDVPILADSPLAFELEVKSSIPLDDGEVFLCAVRNVLVDESLADTAQPISARIAAIAPVHTTCGTYFGWDGKEIGRWGEPMKREA